MGNDVANAAPRLSSAGLSSGMCWALAQTGEVQSQDQRSLCVQGWPGRLGRKTRWMMAEDRRNQNAGYGGGKGTRGDFQPISKVK